MNTKEIILQMLQKIQSERELSEGFIALIEAGFMDEEIESGIVSLILKEIKQLPKGEKKSELEQLLKQMPQELLSHKESLSDTDKGIE